MNNRNAQLRLPTVNCQGFSLVEVVLAMGVMSFALLGMVALLPMGLKSSHMANDAMTQAQIVQYVRNELETTPFNSLASSWDYNLSANHTTLYFDNQGLPTTQTDAEQIYKVTFTVSQGVSMTTLSGSTTSNNTLLGANANAPNAAADADLVTVTIVNRTTPGASSTSVFPIVVPNAGF